MSQPEAPPIKSLAYYLTEACNLRCSYCYLTKTPRRSNFQVGKAVIDCLIKESRSEPLVHLRFFGGEPLLELELMQKVVSYGKELAAAAGKEIVFDMVSNGTLLAPSTVRKLAELGVEVIASVDGGIETMNENRPFHLVGGFEGLERKYTDAIEQGVTRTARMTVAPKQRRLRADLEYILSLGFPTVQMTLANNVRWEEAEINSLYEELADFYIDHVRAGDVPRLSETNELLVTYHEILQGKHVPVRTRFCGAGKDMLGVGADGDLYLCHRFLQDEGDQHRMGSVFSGVDNAKRQPFAIIDAETQHHDICNQCPAFDYCPGSCMAANYTENRDLLYPESRHCWDLRAHVRAVQRIYQTLMCEGNSDFETFLEAAWKKRRAKRLVTLLREEAVAP
jgi:uncharacterized protein